MKLGVAAALVDDRYVKGDVSIDPARGAIEEVGLASWDGRGVACPGFVDLQVNGFGGVDFALADVDAYTRAGTALAASGVTAYQPTLITGPIALMKSGLGVAAQAQGVAGGAHIIGVHLEGPFIAAERRGAHDAAHLLAAELPVLADLVNAGPVTLVTLAPELAGAGKLIDFLREAGITTSCGHSNASAEEADEAFKRGARVVTHLFNAMRPFHHRAPGLVGAALTGEVTMTLIADPFHVDGEAVLLAFAAGPGRVALISDANAATCAPPGHYTLGGTPIISDGTVARRDDGTLAGPVGDLRAGVLRAVNVGVPPERAIASVTTVPARTVGAGDVGRLRPGGRADVVVMDDSFEILRVLVGGRDATGGEA